MYKVKYWKNGEEITLKYLNQKTAINVASVNNGYIVGVSGYLGTKKVNNSAYINRQFNISDTEFYVKYQFQKTLESGTIESCTGESRVMSYSECMDFIEGMEIGIKFCYNIKRNIQLIHCSTELDYLDGSKMGIV